MILRVIYTLLATGAVVGIAEAEAAIRRWSRRRNLSSTHVLEDK